MAHSIQHMARRARFVGVLMALVFPFVVAPVAGAAPPPVVTVTPNGSRAVAPMLYDVERYALRLMNCIRTGGYLRTDGSCRAWGSGANGGYRPPFILSAAVSDRVARPYAKLLVKLDACNHWYDGSPYDRLRRAGISFSNYGENIGCRDGTNAYRSVLASHLYFQSEKSYNGWHWRNIKDPGLTRVGIGVWQVGTRIRFVEDFYRP